MFQGDVGIESEEQLIVVGTRTEQRRSDSPVAAEVITRKQIEESSATNVAQIMAMSGGVQVDRSFAGVSVALQGLDAKHTLILIDGERVTGLKDGVFDLERVNLEQVERIEILQGAGSALYGADAIGGVVNIISRKMSGNHEVPVSAGAALHYGTDESVEASGRALGKVGSLTAQGIGGYHSLPSFTVTDNHESPETHGSAVADWYARSTVKWRRNGRAELRLGGEHSQRERTGIDVSDTGAVFDRRQVIDQ